MMKGNNPKRLSHGMYYLIIMPILNEDENVNLPLEEEHQTTQFSNPLCCTDRF